MCLIFSYKLYYINSYFICFFTMYSFTSNQKQIIWLYHLIFLDLYYTIFYTYSIILYLTIVIIL